MAKPSSNKRVKTSKNFQNEVDDPVTIKTRSKNTATIGTLKQTKKTSNINESTKDTLINSKKDRVKQQQRKKEERIVTMKALREMSDDDDNDGELPPESEWTKEALSLKAAIEAGKFDEAVLRNNNNDDNDGSSFEEVDLESDDEDDDDDQEAPTDEYDEQNEIDADPDEIGEEEEDDVDVNDEEEEDDDEADEMDDDDEVGEDGLDEDGNVMDENDDKDVDEANVDKISISNEQDDDADDNDDDEEEEEEDADEDEDNDDETRALFETNATRAKALQVVTASLLAEKKEWEWSETFDIVPPTPLPFNKDVVKMNGLSPSVASTNPLGIHDDLQREVAFYDVALEAVLEAKSLCHQAGIPFTRPDDFFAEMVKTDDHMAKVKDRLIFEGKKIEAVAQRKSNKEQKLRAKETQANKLAEKAKKKRDHMQQVNDWAESAKASRGGNDNTSITTNKKRTYSDQKFGHGGKRGRFKQNDPLSTNDMSSYNKKKGTFTNSPKTKQGRKSGAGANRQGKRARDSSRSKSR